MQVRKQQLELDMEWQPGSKSGKEYVKAVILSPCLINLYEEYIMWNTRLDEPQAGIKISGKNINNRRYADYTTLLTENEEELKSLLMKVKEESSTGRPIGLLLRPQIKYTTGVAPSSNLEVFSSFHLPIISIRSPPLFDMDAFKF